MPAKRAVPHRQVPVTDRVAILQGVPQLWLQPMLSLPLRPRVKLDQTPGPLPAHHHRSSLTSLPTLVVEVVGLGVALQ